MVNSAIIASSQDAIHQLWNTLADYPAARTDDALMHFYQVVMPLIGAQHAFWTLLVRLGTDGVAERDLCGGWRTRDIVLADPTPERVASVRRFLEGNEKQDPVHLGDTTINLMRRAGQYRAERLHGGLVDWEAFRRTPHYQLYYESPGVTDRLWIVSPVNEDVENCFCFDRISHPNEPRFSDEELALAESILRPLLWFHRRLVLSRGVIAGQTPCTPGEHRVLSLLLTGQSEKEIAEALRLSVRTTHNRVTTIFKKLGVRSRAELMALWL